MTQADKALQKFEVEMYKEFLQDIPAEMVGLVKTAYKLGWLDRDINGGGNGNG